jgi:uncharacterized protein (TIGR02145 family)
LTWVAAGGGVINGNTVTFASGAVTGTKTVKAQSSQTYNKAPTCYSAEVSQSATVNPVPTIERRSGTANQTVTQGTAISTNIFTASNATSISRSGSLPTGVSGTATTNAATYTISGTPTTATTTGTYSYTVTAANTNGCPSASISGTITVNHLTPPGAASTQTWTIGNQTWSAYLKKAQTGCNATTNFGSAGVPASALYRSSGLYSESGYLYNWKCVNDYATQLCPSPWRVPTSADFVALDKALGGSGGYENASVTWVTSNYVTKWGGVYAGYGLYTSVYEGGYSSSTWANSTTGNNGYVMLFRNDGSKSPLHNVAKSHGLLARCVK